ncbi:hypothetical protein QJQ45_019489 [Haematococcus lacustris]|nr:hypothetical protein QJQ45_019489 [Haematococcus lacustris]
MEPGGPLPPQPPELTARYNKKLLTLEEISQAHASSVYAQKYSIEVVGGKIKAVCNDCKMVLSCGNLSDSRKHQCNKRPRSDQHAIAGGTSSDMLFERITACWNPDQRMPANIVSLQEGASGCLHVLVPRSKLMTDLKAAFRAVKEQRGISAPTAAQVRAAKALKQQQQLQQQQTDKAKPGQQSSANTAGGPSPKPAHVSVPAAPSTAAGLPADFFQSSRKESTAVASASVAPRPASSTAQPAAPVAPVKPPSAGTQQGNTRGPTAAASLPQGFFSDKEADAKARGVKLPDAKQKEHEFQEFQQMLEAELKTAAALEADAAEEEAEDRREREDFVQWVRMQRLEELKKRKELAAPVIAAEASEPPDETLSVAEELLEVSTVAPGVAGAVLSSLAPAAKRRRVLDTLLELQIDEEDEDGVDGADEDPLLNWRAKGVMSLRKTAAPAPSTSPASKTATRASPMEVAQIASEASFITGTALTMVAMTLVVSCCIDPACIKVQETQALLWASCCCEWSPWSKRSRSRQLFRVSVTHLGGWGLDGGRRSLCAVLSCNRRVLSMPCNCMDTPGQVLGLHLYFEPVPVTQQSSELST